MDHIMNKAIGGDYYHCCNLKAGELQNVMVQAKSKSNKTMAIYQEN